MPEHDDLTELTIVTQRPALKLTILAGYSIFSVAVFMFLNSATNTLALIGAIFTHLVPIFWWSLSVVALKFGLDWFMPKREVTWCAVGMGWLIFCNPVVPKQCRRYRINDIDQIRIAKRHSWAGWDVFVFLQSGKYARERTEKRKNILRLVEFIETELPATDVRFLPIKRSALPDLSSAKVSQRNKRSTSTSRQAADTVTAMTAPGAVAETVAVLDAAIVTPMADREDAGTVTALAADPAPVDESLATAVSPNRLNRETAQPPGGEPTVDDTTADVSSRAQMVEAEPGERSIMLTDTRPNETDATTHTPTERDSAETATAAGIDATDRNGCDQLDAKDETAEIMGESQAASLPPWWARTRSNPRLRRPYLRPEAVDDERAASADSVLYNSDKRNDGDDRVASQENDVTEALEAQSKNASEQTAAKASLEK